MFSVITLMIEKWGSKSCKTPLKFLREEVIITLNGNSDIVLTVFKVLAP